MSKSFPKMSRSTVAVAAVAFIALAILSGGLSACRPPATTPLTLTQQLFESYGRALETARTSIELTTDAVGAAYQGHRLTAEQVARYRDAAVLADQMISVAARALLAASYEGPERQQEAITAVGDALRAVSEAVALSGGAN